MEFAIVVVAILVALTAKGIYDKKQLEIKLRAKCRKNYGKRIKKEFDEARAQSIPFYCREKARSDGAVDDITWNDLEMDRVYFALNSCKSAIGDEYLYAMLRNPISDIEELKERDRVIEVLDKDEELRTALGVFLMKTGSIKHISVYEYIGRLNNIQRETNLLHALQALLLGASIGFIFVNPAIGILSFCVMFFVNMLSYFKRKSQIDCYFSIFSYIMGMLSAAKGITRLRALDKNRELEGYIDKVEKAAKTLSAVTRGSEIFINPLGSGNILQSLLDYIRIAFHIDLMKFNSVVRKFADKKSEFDIMFENIGFLDCMLAVASYREYEGDFCKPQLECTRNEGSVKAKTYLYAEELAHPLIDEPVTNSLSTDKAILLTGSNASGKSTFLKTVAINAILAQTIYTVRAESYRASCFRVMSSIAMHDDLEMGESYYIVEIKSLKRVLDYATEKGKLPVLCFIDEVLRGTNTVERIAASTEILKTLAQRNSLCFAATHDIELTYNLEEDFRNFHFEEKVEDDEVSFDYTLHEGRATSKNAIKLLKMMGYDTEIVNAAAQRAELLFKQTL